MQICVCLNGQLMITLVLCLVNPFIASGQDRMQGKHAAHQGAPLARPLASKPSFLKRFTVGQKQAIFRWGVPL